MMRRVPRPRPVPPAYRTAVTLISVALMIVVSSVISTALADRNARELVARYETDKRKTADANREFYCALFASQLDAFDEAISPAGRKSRDAWLGVYRVGNCQPARD